MTITYERVKELFDYVENGTLIRKIRTSNRNNVGDIAGSNNGNGYLRFSINRKSYYVHQIVFLWNFGYIPNEIDHKNGNRLDNRIENLREATHLQNGQNLGLRKSNNIGINSVSFDKERKKWIAYIGVNRRKIHLGRFDNVEDAINARKNAEKIYYKEFSRMKNNA